MVAAPFNLWDNIAPCRSTGEVHLNEVDRTFTKPCFYPQISLPQGETCK